MITVQNYLISIFLNLTVKVYHPCLTHYMYRCVYTLPSYAPPTCTGWVGGGEGVGHMGLFEVYTWILTYECYHCTDTAVRFPFTLQLDISELLMSITLANICGFQYLCTSWQSYERFFECKVIDFSYLCFSDCEKRENYVPNLVLYGILVK